MTRKELGAIALGLLWASVAPMIIFATARALEADFQFDDWLMLFPFYGLCSIAVSVLLGLPIFFMLRRFRPGSWWLSALVGLMIGGAVLTLLTVGLPGNPGPHFVLAALSSGVIAALGFWWIWKRSLAMS